MDIPETVITGFFTAAIGVVGIAFRTLYSRITAAADKCERDREQLWGKANELSDKVKDLEDRLEDCPTTDCPARPRTRAPQKPDYFRPTPRQLPGGA